MRGGRDAHRIVLVAGEPSGDALGARLIPALRDRAPGPLDLKGVAGPLMIEQGMDSLFPITDLTLMGLAEVVPSIPRVLRRLQQTVTAIERWRPDAVVTIDSPGFCFRLARRLHGHNAPIIHYVAPTVWAWRPGRARDIATIVDHLLTLLPFEPPYFEAVNLPATFVGHPVVEAAPGDGPAFRGRHGLDADTPVLCVLPGSRRGEVGRLLSPFGQAVRRLCTRFPRLRVLVPTVPAVAGPVRQAVADWPGAPVLVDPVEKADAFAAATVALAASGTVSLELAVAGVPQVIAYRVNPLTAAIVRRLIRVRWASLVNILADDDVVPELLQAACTPDALADTVGHLLATPEARAQQVARATTSVDRLRADGASASATAAQVVFEMIGGWSYTD